MEGSILLLVLSLMTLRCYGNTIQREESPFSDSYLHDDIRLSPEQEQMMKERGFFTPGKWPLYNEQVTVPFYFDQRYPLDPDVREKFKIAINLYATQTCIKWVEVSPTERRHKVRVFKGDGCHSNVGMLQNQDNELSLGNGCEIVGTMIHEMGHCMGLFHTQSRPDRDNYVKVWWKNVKPGQEHNFEISTGDLYGVPYDYKSMMHYGSYFFSINGSFTLSTVDPFALYSIGSRAGNFRWSDALFLNRAYTCDKIFTRRCPALNCLNDGYVGADCTCKCPENTVGDRCERVTGPFFSDVPKCGGLVTSPGQITSYIGGVSVTDKCIFKVVAPRCKLPTITFTEANFNWPACDPNQLTVQVSTKYFGFTWCRNGIVPLGKTLVSDTNMLGVYYYTSARGFPQYGFKADVDFLNDPSCGNPGPPVPTTTASTTRTTTTESTTRSTTTPSTVRPQPGGSSMNVQTTGPCTISNPESNTYVYKSPGYPSPVTGSPKCMLDMSLSDRSAFMFMKVTVSNIKHPDKITLQDGFSSYSYDVGLKSLVTYHLFPVQVDFLARSSPSPGFSVTYTRATGLPGICNGDTVRLNKGQSVTVNNPLVGMGDKNVRCLFKIENTSGYKITFEGTRLGLSINEFLVYKGLDSQSYFDDVKNVPKSLNGNAALVYYMGAETYANWEVKITAE